jgi:tetratricopeptide (TPR) repeat protein
MIDFIESLPTHVKNTVMVQEQLGFALNRENERDRAIKVLETVIQQNGPSSETYGILGRVYKDKYDDAVNKKNEALAEACLDKAIETYLKGFETDWRDAYPGTNVLTLLEINNDKEKVRELIPVVEYSVNRKIKSKVPTYWDYATLLEIAVIANNEAKAKENFTKALSCSIEGDWMYETTIKNLKLISEARMKRNGDVGLVKKMIEALQTQLDN